MSPSAVACVRRRSGELAPLAGGRGTPELAAAVREAEALGSLGGGHLAGRRSSGAGTVVLRTAATPHEAPAPAACPREGKVVKSSPATEPWRIAPGTPEGAHRPAVPGSRSDVHGAGMRRTR
ncbi:nitronate monooxygenase [Anaeromyxobacter terrae]|uniref:nitronate monooxygenase n=1 Tax=Anaeromyxobacter terrae TaxID=2925406 RepID=UPI001F5A97B0|nr:nitronate monooxygenase [Anaeromyxobacter sp. SG22]